MNYSVLMSIYEKENPIFLDECLNSIFFQTLLPSEVVIVKDGFIPINLDEVLNKYKLQYPNHIKIVSLEENKGLGEALNFGLNFCSFEIIARMDTDDICVPDRFEIQINFLIENRNIDVVGSWIDEFETSKDYVISQRKLPVTHEAILKFAKKRNPLNHMTVVFKKSSVLQAGGYLPLLWNEDYYLWGRMLVKGKKFANIPESLVKVRAGTNMISRRGGLNYFKNEILLQREFYLVGFINKRQYISNLFIRGIFRIVPVPLRKILYMNFLRSK